MRSNHISIFRLLAPESLQENNIGEVRNKLVDITLIALGVFSIPPLVASILEVKEFGWDIAKISQIGAVTTLFIYLLFRNKISYRIKAITIIVILLILGCTSLITLGMAGTGTLFLMITVILSTIYFGSRGGAYALLGTIIPYLVISIFIFVGFSTISIHLEELHKSLSSWISDILLFILFSGIIIFTAGKLYSTMSNNISTLNQRNEKLEEENILRKKAEEELIIARDEALAANRAKSDFLTNMGHEIRTPLHAITGYSEMIEQRLSDKTNISYLDSIKSSTLKLLHMITTILDLSALETGNFESNFEFIEADKWFSDVMNLFRPSAEDKNLKFISEISKGFPALFYTDNARITTVLSNLTENAIKFTEKGHVKISLDCSKGNAHDHKDIVISIEDTGIGIPEELLNKQVPNFTQEDGKSNRKYEGIGLGLSLSRKLIERLSGTLEIRSQIGKGTTITVRLPEVKIKQTKIDRTSSPVKDTESKEASYDISETSAEKIRSDTIHMWEQLKKKQPMEDVLVFGQRVKTIGEEDNIEVLADYGRNLCESVELYDIDNMLKLLREYSQLLRKFKIIE